METNPAGVTVYIDGVERGVTPLTINDLRQGDYLVRLSRDGYETRTFNVTVFNSSRLNVAVKMRELHGFVNLTVRRSPASPQSLPFEPHIVNFLHDHFQTRENISPDGSLLLTLPSTVNTINIRAFGWENVSVPVLVEENITTELNIVMQSAQMEIEGINQRQARFNPLNPGAMGLSFIRFQVTTYGTGTMTVFDSNNSAVYTEELRQFDNPFQTVTWNGRDSDGNTVPQGTYTITIEARTLDEYSQGETEIVSVSIQTAVNYSLNTLPLSIENVSAGLTFSPLPHVLTSFGNYQISVNAAFDGSGFPFKIGFRFLPFNRFELTAGFSVNPQLEENVIWSISGSAKYNFINKTDSLPIAFSLGVSYEWATGTHENSLSRGIGVSFFAPLSFELANFSIALSPAAFWRGPETPVPEFQLSAGILYRASWFNAGISARYEFDFNDINDSRFLAGAEARFFPAPLFIFYSIQGGVILRGEQLSGYGGLGIGIIY